MLNNAKTQTAYLGENVINFHPKLFPFWGYFFNEPPKSSLIGEKLPNLVTLLNILLTSFHS
jgi:hypothetical protein